MNKWGKQSKAVLSTLHPAWKIILDLALKQIDITLVCGLRGQAEQDLAFREGKSKLRFPASRHNRTSDPYWALSSRDRLSDAVDLVPAGKGYKAGREELSAMAAVIFDAAARCGVTLRWGGDFNRDGDKTTWDAWDLYHFEILWPSA